jgi:hypothetical protein
MPTSLPTTFSSDLVAPPVAARSDGPGWLILIWAVAMLVFAALTGAASGTGEIDAFQLLATF